MSQRFACAVSPHHHSGRVGGAWGATTRVRSFPSLSAAASLFLSFWAMEGQHGRPDTTDLQKACRCNGRSKGRPCPCPARGLGGTATFQKGHVGVAAGRCATCGDDENAIPIQRLSPLICLLLAMFPPAACPLCGFLETLAGCRGCAGPKKRVGQGPLESVVENKEALVPESYRDVSPRRAFARGGAALLRCRLHCRRWPAHVRHEQLQCRPSAALHSCLCMPSHPATTPPPRQRGKGSALRVAWQARLARLAFQLAVELMETANRNSRHGHGIRQNGQR